jgi:hypothetical protein
MRGEKAPASTNKPPKAREATSPASEGAPLVVVCFLVVGSTETAACPAGDDDVVGEARVDVVVSSTSLDPERDK